MNRDEFITEIQSYIENADNATFEDSEFIRGWKSAMLVTLELAYKLDVILNQ